MIKINNNICIGDSDDVIDFGRVQKLYSIKALFNVAQDLHIPIGWPDIEYAQVGLIDGPGNVPSVYHAAVLTLAMLIKRHKVVMVCCHSGTRSVAVIAMYMSLSAIIGQGWPGDWQVSWYGWLSWMRSQSGQDIPVPHDEHKKAFDMMNWRLLTTVMGG